MKTKKAKVRRSKTPPPGWPTEAEWIEIEKKLEKSLPSLVLPANASPVDRAKQELCGHFVRYMLKENITQRKFSQILRVSEARISEITHYHHKRFTIDKLIKLLVIIKPNLRLEVA